MLIREGISPSYCGLIALSIYYVVVLLVRMGYGLLARVGLNYIWNNMAPDFLEIKNSAYDPIEAIEKIEQHYFQGKTPAEADESAYDHVTNLGLRKLLFGISMEA